MSTTVMTLPSYMAGFLYEIGPPGGGVYSYVSYPSAVLPNRPKYRNEQNNNGPVNIMHDKRVIRGNTYAISQRFPPPTGSQTMSNPHPPMRFGNASSPGNNDDVIKQRQAERRSYVRKRVLPTIGTGLAAENKNRPRIDLGGLTNSAGSSTGKSSSENGLANSDARFTAARARVRKRLAQFQNNEVRKIPGTTARTKRGNNRVAPEGRADTSERPPVEGRQHKDMQTEKWLEEIKDRVPETEVGVQTEEVLFAAATGPHANGDPSAAASSEAIRNGPRDAFQTPPPDSSDKATQIGLDDPDLFVFDEDVVIVLDALVGKTVEQSLLEVIGEEEKAVEEKMQRKNE